VPEGLREYKRKEKLFYAKLISASIAFVRVLSSMPRKILAWGKKKLTFAILPHSDSPSFRIEANRFFILAAAIFAFALLTFSVIATGRYALVATALEAARKEAAESRLALDSLRDGAESLAGSALKFQTQLADLLSIGGSNTSSQDTVGQSEALKTAGLAALLNMPKNGELARRELDRLEGLSGYLDEAAPGLERIAQLLAGQKEIMSEIPNIWPIKGGIGHISMYFGQNENPFSDGQWYLHNGIDISTFGTSDPILAAADGKVIDSSYDAGLGLSVTIQHSHGFLTRYGHLRSARVSKGQQVAQSQVIGTLGNTGKTTGPHLHYEVHLGTSIIDPLRFLNVRKAYMP